MFEITMVQHVIGLHHLAIGTENVVNTANYPMKRIQEKANIALVQYLAKHNYIEYLKGGQYKLFENTPLWLLKIPATEPKKPITEWHTCKNTMM